MIYEFGSEFYKESEFESYYEYISKINVNKYFIRCGRDAIRLIAKNLKSNVVLLPSFCCESMISPFQDCNKEIRYYKIKSDFSIDTDDLIKKADCDCSILIMNYFGLNKTDKIINEIRLLSFNVEIIEDFTHIALDIVDLFNYQVDYYVCSMRKWMPIVEGGIIITNKNLGKINYWENNKFSENRKKGFSIKNKFLNFVKDDLNKNEYRRLFDEADLSLSNDKRIMQASDESVKYLQRINYLEIYRQRSNNYSILYDMLKEFDCLLPKIETCPFNFPVNVFNRNNVQKNLSNDNLYLQVIWPINDKQKECCKEAFYISEHILCIPIDQRYNSNDMMQISKLFKKEIMKWEKEF